MRFYIVLFALLGVAFARDPPLQAAVGEEEEVFAAFIECIRKALDGGLPDAGIPDHNPFIAYRNLTFPIDLAGVTGYVKFEPFYIEDIVDAILTGVTGAYSDDNARIIYDYHFHWDQMRVHTDWEADLNILSENFHVAGIINCTFVNFDADGLWDMVIASPKSLNEYTLVLSVDLVDFKIEGLGELIDTTISDVLTLALTTFVNANPPAWSDEFVPLLQQIFNTEWLDEADWYRTDLIIENCHANKK